MELQKLVIDENENIYLDGENGVKILNVIHTFLQRI